MKRPHGFALIALGLSLMAGCLFSPSLPTKAAQGGSGTDNTNGTLVSARVFYSDGSPARNAAVWIRSYEFLRDTGNTEDTVSRAQARTDSAGRVSLDSLSEGEYVMEVSDGNGHALMRPFSSSGGLEDLGEDTLHAVGSLSGVLQKSDGSSAAGYVQIYGLDRMVKTDSSGAFFFDSLPSGLLRVHAVSSAPGKAYLQPDPILVDSGTVIELDTLKLASFADEDYSSWPFFRPFQINTASLGLTETLIDFPLLVRLDSSNFNFGLSNGKDLRFAAADGKHLPYEIERWDAGARQAEIWVRLDSLKTSSNATSLKIYFGRRNIPDFSNGASVFSSFLGVWHMQNTIVRGAPASISDAAPNGTSAVGVIGVSDRSGAVGLGAQFSGSEYLKVAGKPELMPEKVLSVSAWVKGTAIDSQGGEIISMGDNYGLRLNGYRLPKIFAYTDSASTSTSGLPLAGWAGVDLTKGNIIDGHWHYASGVLDGETMHLYLDGVEKGSLPFTGPISYRLGKDFWIGKHGNGLARFDFMGGLDEIEVSGRAHSADWIKLSYENQKPGSTLIQSKPGINDINASIVEARQGKDPK